MKSTILNKLLFLILTVHSLIAVSQNRAELSQEETNARLFATAKERSGQLAILPFDYISNENSNNMDIMALKLQGDCYQTLREHTSMLEIQDPVTTIAILQKAGLGPVEIKSKTPKELALILNVQYVVYGRAMIDNVGVSSTSHGWETTTGLKTVNKPNDVKSQEKQKSNTPNLYVTGFDNYQFSYDAGNNKLKEAVTTNYGNLQATNEYENGQLVKNQLSFNSNTAPLNYRKDIPQQTTNYSSTSQNFSNNSTVVNYNSVIDLSFYDDTGRVLYSKTRTAFGSGIDSYMATLKYLIKRCPFGTKNKK
ncbi:hypothetical protein [Flavobacterium sp. T12S277]|uniref:hypothetical protein n=1 Tax=Flavobacterium sp. T12S277 TaxID=3402752 RepID=UPI003AEABB5D